MKIKVLFTYLVIVIVSVSVSFFINRTSAVKVAWFNLPEVFNSFEYKKEMEKKYIKTEETRKKIIDSLELELKILVKSIEADRNDKDKLAQFSAKRERYYEKKQQFEEDNSQMKTQFNSEIYTQLNQYVKDYGKEKGYKIVFSAEGSGALMYGDPVLDITQELKGYVNEKYQGKTK